MFRQVLIAMHSLRTCIQRGAHQARIWQLHSAQMLLDGRWPLLHEALNVGHGVPQLYCAAWLGLHVHMPGLHQIPDVRTTELRHSWQLKH